tara:strand:- start:113 stop:508 length:396 start_codon:yes stop_codon:yes gene_type:complete
MNFTLKNVEDYTKNLTWMLKTLNQIEKEFCSQAWVFTKPTLAESAFEDISQQLEPKISRLIDNNGVQYCKQILYTIDVSERQITTALTLNADALFSNVLTNLIIKRCLQKVLIRNYYKSPEKDALGSSLEE